MMTLFAFSTRRFVSCATILITQFYRKFSTENRNEITSAVDSHHEISSPFFPMLYARDYSIEHVLTCKTDDCRIHLMFTDFQLATPSSMEFYDTDGQRLFYTGSTFRPPILISSGPSLIVRFYANGVSDVGYKAKVTFIASQQVDDPILKPQLNCGGLVEHLGGAITMMNMTKENDTSEVDYDCVWIIRPSVAYVSMKTHISLKVETFAKMAEQSSISIMQGSTSDRPLLETIQSSSIANVQSRNLVIAFSSGFYVHLRGKFKADSTLAIVYTAFSYSSKYVLGKGS